jgi:hypothetical protein
MDSCLSSEIDGSLMGFSWVIFDVLEVLQAQNVLCWSFLLCWSLLCLFLRGYLVNSRAISTESLYVLVPLRYTADTRPGDKSLATDKHSISPRKNRPTPVNKVNNGT